MAAALATVGFDCLALVLDRQPDAIELHHRRHIRDGFIVGLLHQRFDLIDALIERAQSHTTAQNGTPASALAGQRHGPSRFPGLDGNDHHA